ncbi:MULTISPECIES: WxL domain-containing protein [Lactococcus]|uniref:WxL domain-containing protein n=1 Tax=Lactococcus TaxID=1357 RepID=UPI000EE61817|nr:MULTISPECIES: WxL domain-containing protein [Lactococcus]HAP14486.1 hypothetical protein [Lactococcus sp.]
MKRLFIINVVLSLALLNSITTNKISAAVPHISQKATITITLKLSAQNIIISETTAKSLTESQLKSLMNVAGENLAGLQLDANTIKTANAGLEGRDYLDIPVTWTTSYEKAQAHLVLVADEAVISSDRQKAVNAYPVTLGQDIANEIGASRNQEKLDFYTRAKAYQADGTVSPAVLANAGEYFSALKNAASNDVVPITYNFSAADKTLSKSVDVTIFSGSLNFTSAPSIMSFGQLKVKTSSLRAFPSYDQDVVVTDTREVSKNTGWTMFVKENHPLVEVDESGVALAGGRSLVGALWFSADGVNKTMLSANNTLVHSELAGTKGGTFNLSQNWNGTTQKGIYLEVPVTQQYAAKYQGGLTWTLSDVPSN